VTDPVENSFGYSGEMWDKTTGLQYLRARWYDPSMGRFINEDTYEGDITNPLSQNLYTYVHNNPLRYTDPSGHCVWDLCIGETVAVYLLFGGATVAAIGVGLGTAKALNESNVNVFDTYEQGTVVIQQPNSDSKAIVIQQPWFQVKGTVSQQERVSVIPKEQFDLMPAYGQQTAINSGVVLFDAAAFEKGIVNMSPNERVATVLGTAAVIAGSNGWVKDSKLGKMNNRVVYKDPATGTLYALDTQHGRFEVVNAKGAHQGEVDFNLDPTKPADTSGRHDLKVK
ncbi:RHS repeat-associated core domain-containing protein, partial [Paenibacillus kobensis]|uniref:RHS repeat-associated core domain-containing protein n=1 Tax=Paenibacillus kobensis TaxID=59841 RepID=UPI002482B2D8